MVSGAQPELYLWNCHKLTHVIQRMAPPPAPAPSCSAHSEFAAPQLAPLAGIKLRYPLRWKSPLAWLWPGSGLPVAASAVGELDWE